MLLSSLAGEHGSADLLALLGEDDGALALVGSRLDDLAALSERIAGDGLSSWLDVASALGDRDSLLCLGTDLALDRLFVVSASSGFAGNHFLIYTISSLKKVVSCVYVISKVVYYLLYIHIFLPPICASYAGSFHNS